MQSISKGYITYSEAYSPNSFIDDDDIERLSEILNYDRLININSLKLDD